MVRDDDADGSAARVFGLTRSATPAEEAGAVGSRTRLAESNTDELAAAAAKAARARTPTAGRPVAPAVSHAAQVASLRGKNAAKAREMKRAQATAAAAIDALAATADSADDLRLATHGKAQAEQSAQKKAAEAAAYCARARQARKEAAAAKHDAQRLEGLLAAQSARLERLLEERRKREALEDAEVAAARAPLVEAIERERIATAAARAEAKRSSAQSARRLQCAATEIEALASRLVVAKAPLRLRDSGGVLDPLVRDAAVELAAGLGVDLSDVASATGIIMKMLDQISRRDRGAPLVSETTETPWGGNLTAQSVYEQGELELLYICYMACVESRYVSLLFDSTSTKKEYREYMSASIGVGDSIHELDLADWTRGKSALDVAAYVFEIFTKKIIPAQRLLMAHGVFAPRLVTYTWPHMCTFSCTDNENTMPATLAEFEHYRVISHVLFDLVGAVEEIAPVADTHALVLTASSRLADEDAKSLGDLDRPHLRRTPPVPRAVTSSDLTDADDAAATCEIKDRETLALQPHVITFTKKVDKERAEKLAKTDTMLRSRFLAAVRHAAKRAAATAAAAAAAAALHFLTEAATAALAAEAQQTVVGASGGESGDRCADDRHTARVPATVPATAARAQTPASTTAAPTAPAPTAATPTAAAPTTPAPTAAPATAAPTTTAPTTAVPTTAAPTTTAPTTAAPTPTTAAPTTAAAAPTNAAPRAAVEEFVPLLHNGCVDHVLNINSSGQVVGSSERGGVGVVVVAARSKQI